MKARDEKTLLFKMLFVSVPRRLLSEVTTRSLSQVSAAEKPVEPPRSALIIGGGIIGISSALQLARRGVKVTVVEECSQVSQGASYRNGAILCQSMAASWASAHLLSENPGECKGRFQLNSLGKEFPNKYLTSRKTGVF